MGARAINNGTSHGREDHSATDSRDQETTTALGVATETSQAERKDGREAGRLKAEDKNQASDRGIPTSGDGRDCENEAKSEICREHESGLDRRDHHQETSNEAVRGI